MNVILDRLHLYGSALELSDRTEEPDWEKGELETMGASIMSKVKAAKLIIEEYKKENSHN